MTAAVLLFFLGLSAPVPGKAAADEEIDARLGRIEGTVYMHLKEHPEDEYVSAVDGASLSEGDIVRTGIDGSAEVTLDGDSVVELSPGTDFVVVSLTPSDARFHLGVGSLLAKIHALMAGRNMSFQTGTAVAAVRGTELAISNQETDLPATIGVMDEGHVLVRSGAAGRGVLLGPLQETEVSNGMAPSAPRALRSLSPYRGQMQAVRRRVEAIRRVWMRRTPAQRRALRALRLKERTLRRERLRNLRDIQRKRAYGGLLPRRRTVRRKIREIRRERRRKRAGN